MKLTKYEQEMLDGTHGEEKQYAMEKLVEFGTAVGVEEMVPITMTLHVCPIMSEKQKGNAKLNMYDPGFTPLHSPFFAMKDAKVANSQQTWAGTDPFLAQLDKYEEEGYPWNFTARGQTFKVDEEIFNDFKRGCDGLAKQGWVNWLSCTPQFNVRIPKFGEYICSSESSVAAYCNMFLGTKANRENCAISIYTAYTGCMPKYGTQLDENRTAKLIIELDDEVRDNLVDTADWSALGSAIADKGRNRISAVLNLPQIISNAAASQLSACASPGMNDPMLHLMGHTPGTRTLEDAFGGEVSKDVEHLYITMADMKEAYRILNEDIAPIKDDKIDIVILGCPHLPFETVREVAERIKGKKVKEDVHFWVQTDTFSYYLAQHFGYAKIIEDAGDKLFHQTCMGFLPMSHFPKGINIATNSFKYIKLAGGFDNGWAYATIPDLIEAAVTGKLVHTGIMTK